MNTTTQTSSNGKHATTSNGKKPHPIKVQPLAESKPDQATPDNPGPTIDDFNLGFQFIDAVMDVLSIVDHEMLATQTIASLMAESRVKLQAMHSFTEDLHERTKTGGRV